MHDLVIRNGFLVDGSGAPGRHADVTVDDGIITSVEPADSGAAARRSIDADGALVTPGFVDIHTHYDAQASWDPYLTPSSWHGVTTVVMGNCGVGFAPAAPDRHEWLIALMEGVEDIPGSGAHRGHRVGLGPRSASTSTRSTGKQYVLDLGTQSRRTAPLRAYVMGDRGAANEPATDDDIAGDGGHSSPTGLRAGALGFSTSRTPLHRSKDGRVGTGDDGRCLGAATASPTAMAVASATACSSSLPSTRSCSRMA